MLIREVQYVLPMSVEEYKVGYLYSHHGYRQRNATKVKAVPIAFAPYKTSDTEALYQHQMLTLKGLPTWTTAWLPGASAGVDCKTWIEYPHVYASYSIPFLGDKLSFSVETLHVPNDRGGLKNALGLSPVELRIRQVVKGDITNDHQVGMVNGLGSEDPKRFRSAQGRGPLKGNWKASCEPVMGVYSIIRVQAKLMEPFRSKVQEYVATNVQEILLTVARMSFCWIDKWSSLSESEVLSRTLPSMPALLTPPRNPLSRQSKFGSSSAASTKPVSKL